MIMPKWASFSKFHTIKEPRFKKHTVSLYEKNVIFAVTVRIINGGKERMKMICHDILSHLNLFFQRIMYLHIGHKQGKELPEP